MKKILPIFASYLVLTLGSLYATTYAQNPTLNEALNEYHDHNHKKAFDLFTKLAEQKNPVAIFRLGYYYEKGIKRPKDEKKANEYFTEALPGLKKLYAEGNEAGSYHLALMYRNGYGVTINNEKAIEIFLQLEKKNYSPAIRVLGSSYQYGQGVKEDFQKARLYFEKCAALNNRDCIYLLGTLYYFGTGVDVNYKTSRLLFEKAANLGDSNSYTYLGEFYRLGFGVEVDLDKAKSYYQKAIEKEDPKGYLYLAYLYYKAQKPKKDLEQAALYAQKSADLEYAPAQRFVGMLYEYGEGVEKNPEKAFEFYSAAANGGFERAKISVAFCYYNGTGTDKNTRKAFEMIYELAKQGNESAMYSLAYLYDDGIAVDRDNKKTMLWLTRSAEAGYDIAQNTIGAIKESEGNYDVAAYWYKKAAEQDHAEATANLAYLYETGQGVDKDIDKAIKHYEKAWSMGTYWAYYRVGIIFRNFAMEKAQRTTVEMEGRKITKFVFSAQDSENLKKAFGHFKQAAENDHKQAQYYVGMMYEQGEGVDENIEAAKLWYKKAADQGDRDAVAALRRLEKK